MLAIMINSKLIHSSLNQCISIYLMWRRDINGVPLVPPGNDWRTTTVGGFEFQLYIDSFFGCCEETGLIP
jgi:hypothetical protein